MTNNELELITLIKNDENPIEAFEIALNLFFELLDERGTSQDKSFVPRQKVS
jgi:hypothetical protein